MFTKSILAKDVKQGQLFVLADFGKPSFECGIFRRVFKDGYISRMGECIIGTNDLNLTLCNQNNSVFIQE